MGDWRSEINTGKSGASATETTTSDASEIINTGANVDIPEINPDEPKKGLSTPAMIAIGVVAFLLYKKFMR